MLFELGNEGGCEWTERKVLVAGDADRPAETPTLDVELHKGPGGLLDLDRQSTDSGDGAAVSAATTRQ